MTSTNLGRRRLMTLAGALAMTPAAALSANHAAAGPVVLTVTGKIGKTNRPAFDETQDLFFKYHERTFPGAFEFDLAMLEALGTAKAEVAYSGWPRPVNVEGPPLREVLSAAGVESGSIRITALDGFATELDFSSLAEQDWIVALKSDGRYFGIGQRGPSWVLYARRDGKVATTEDESRWPWAAFMIEVE
jgi:hypothetical protein